MIEIILVFAPGATPVGWLYDSRYFVASFVLASYAVVFWPEIKEVMNYRYGKAKMYFAKLNKDFTAFYVSGGEDKKKKNDDN